MSRWIAALIPEKDIKPNIWQSAFQNAWKHFYYHSMNQHQLNEERRCLSMVEQTDTTGVTSLNFTTHEKKLPGKSKQCFVVRKWRIQGHSVDLGAVQVQSHPKCCIQCTKVMWEAGHIELGHYWTFQTPSLPSLSGLFLCHPWNCTQCQG